MRTATGADGGSRLTKSRRNAHMQAPEIQEVQPLPRVIDYTTSGALSFPSFAGEGGAERRMGYGPLLRPKSDCTNGAANLRRNRPAFRTPSGAARHLPRLAEKGVRGDRPRFEDLRDWRRLACS